MFSNARNLHGMLSKRNYNNHSDATNNDSRKTGLPQPKLFNWCHFVTFQKNKLKQVSEDMFCCPCYTIFEFGIGQGGKGSCLRKIPRFALLLLWAGMSLYQNGQKSSLFGWVCKETHQSWSQQFHTSFVVCCSQTLPNCL